MSKVNKRAPYLLTAILSAGLLAGCTGGGEDIAKVNGKNISRDQFASYMELKRLGSPSEERLQALLDQYLEREALAAVIENQQNMDWDLIQAEMNEYRKEMLISRYFEKFLNDQVSEESIQNYYVANPNQ
ncbi:MAG: peptidylprolyl isomerase, partial [Gammaproteobacteria bacterium]|nr:peptidylprolyl isomerase [Gammaproteobacteria bacterium]